MSEEPIFQRLDFLVPGAPVPCGRPRLGAHGQVYVPRETQAYEKHVAAIAHAAAYRARWVKPKAGARIVVGLVIRRGPGKRGDIDNIAKSVLDGITKAANVWADDRDVMRLEALIDDEADKPCVRVLVEAP